MKCSEDNTAAALDLEGLPDEEETASGCFEFRLRTRSLDLHQTPSKHKITKLASLLRSRSDDSVRCNHSSTATGHSPKGSLRNSPHASPAPPTRRRFVRVVRDSADADLENPHVVHKYSSEFLSNLQKSLSLEERRCGPQPYTVTGHTILKKQPSVEHVPESSPTLLHKHASFRDEVEVMEYDRKEKIRRGPLAKHKVRLHDSPGGSMEEDDSDAVETAGQMGEGNQKKRLTSAASLDVPSEDSNFAHIFTSTQSPSESSRTTGHSEWSGEGSACPHATPQILSDEPAGVESSRDGAAQSQAITDSLQKLDINSSGLPHPSNIGPT